MHNRPKSISDIARLMNRDDISNLQYSLRKLNTAQLIKRSDKRDSKRSATYTITGKGKQISDQFAEFRRDLLLNLTDSIKDFDTDVVVASKILNIIAGRRPRLKHRGCAPTGLGKSLHYRFKGNKTQSWRLCKPPLAEIKPTIPNRELASFQPARL